MRYFIFLIAIIQFIAVAEVPTPARFTLTPSVSQYVKADVIGLSTGMEIVVSKNFLKTYDILQNFAEIKAVPHIELGFNIDEESQLSGSASGTIKLHYIDNMGIGAKISYQIDQKKFIYSYTSLYLYSKFPIAYKDGLTVFYTGVRGKNLDYTDPYNSLKSLIGKHVDYFIGINYNLNIVENNVSVNVEYHPKLKELFMCVNFGL